MERNRPGQRTPSLIHTSYRPKWQFIRDDHFWRFKQLRVVFKVAPPSGGGAWTESDLHDWPCVSPGNDNESRVVYQNGLLFGTTTYLGSANLGQAFNLVP